MTTEQWFAIGIIIIMTAWAITTILFTLIKSIKDYKKNETESTAKSNRSDDQR